MSNTNREPDAVNAGAPGVLNFAAIVKAEDERQAKFGMSPSAEDYAIAGASASIEQRAAAPAPAPSPWYSEGVAALNSLLNEYGQKDWHGSPILKRLHEIRDGIAVEAQKGQAALDAAQERAKRLEAALEELNQSSRDYFEVGEKHVVGGTILLNLEAAQRKKERLLRALVDALALAAAPEARDA